MERLTARDIISSLLKGLVIGVGVLALYFAWSLYSFASYGNSRTEIDKAFERQFAQRLSALPPVGQKLMGAQVATFFAPLVGFPPVAICQNDGFDYGGSASGATLKAIAEEARAKRASIKIAKFENLGEDAAAPDFKTTFHFVDDKGVAHARVLFRSGAECQTGASQCAPIENLTLTRTGKDEILLSGPNWNHCPLRGG